MGHKHHSKNELNDISKLTSSWPRISTINAPRNFGEKFSIGIFNVQLGQKKKKKKNLVIISLFLLIIGSLLARDGVMLWFAISY